VYITGFTGSTDFPGTTGGAQETYGGGFDDAFVERLTSDLNGNGGGPVNLSPYITFNPATSTFVTTPATTSCPGGTFSFKARLTNTSTQSFSQIVVKVTTLTNGDLLQNADGGPGGVGATLTVPALGSYGDGVLAPGESVDVSFVICLKTRSEFTFFVDVFGNAE
jgi:hypothetical protein